MATILTFDAWDDNKVGEVAVSVNGVLAASMPEVETPENSGTWIQWELNITNLIVDGVNTLLFNNPNAPTSSSAVKYIIVKHEGVEILNDPDEHQISGSAEPTPNQSWESTFTVSVEPIPPEHVTPWSATLSAGNYRVTFPETAIIDGVEKPFREWVDLPSGDPQKTIPVRDITIVVAETLSLFADYGEPAQPPDFEWLWLIPVALVGIGFVYVIIY